MKRAISSLRNLVYVIGINRLRLNKVMRKSPIPLLLTSSESMHFFTPYFEAKGIEWKATAKEFDLPVDYSSSEDWIPAKSFSLFLNSMSKYCDDDLPIWVGQKAAQRFIQGHWDVVEKGAKFREVIESMMRHAHSFTRQSTYWLVEIDGQWCWCNRSEMKPSFPGSVAYEWFRVAMLTYICRHWLGDDWIPSSLSVMTDEHQGKKYADILFPEMNVHYEQAFMKLELSGVEGLQPVVNKPLTSRDIKEIEILSDSYCHLPHFTLDWLASLFGVTTKTLYRYFKDHNTKFNTIKKRALLKKAQHLLHATEDTVSDISYRMGYRDVSNFNRAIKSMTGFTPAQIRTQVNL
ncbi:hypothetical protein JCM19239_2334 [Vibrio variabilis]|uniref:HTH araC/xylS-type domain-containing protein n=1 Tax=Vibrio variabilis TaxID=990271 RepID=A0ABQ0JB61_9VIBR|nr:hypothetical protein JCM19239_2334 [Vibrio variabilis]